MSGTPPPDGLSEAIAKAIVDDDFYNALKNDPDGTLQGTSLSQGDKEAVKRLLRDKTQEIEQARQDYKKTPTLNAIIVELPPPTS
jgi:hypothetical protein